MTRVLGIVVLPPTPVESRPPLSSPPREAPRSQNLLQGVAASIPYPKQTRKYCKQSERSPDHCPARAHSSVNASPLLTSATTPMNAATLNTQTHPGVVGLIRLTNATSSRAMTTGSVVVLCALSDRLILSMASVDSVTEKR